MIAIVYVDKILLEHQRDLKKKNSTGGLSERLLDSIDEFDEFVDERKEEEEDEDEDEEEGEKEEEREGMRKNSTEGILEAKRIFQNKNCDDDIIMDNYKLKISNDSVLHNNKRNGEERSKTSIQNNIEENSEESCVAREEKSLKNSNITLNTAFSHYNKGKLLLYDAVDDIENDENTALEGEKEVENGYVLNLEENKDIQEVENEEKSDVGEIDGKEQEKQGREKEKEQKKAQQQQHQDEEKEKEKEKKEIIRGELNEKLTNKLNIIENITSKIENEKLHKKKFNSNSLTQNSSENIKSGTNLKISNDKENLVGKKKNQRNAKLSDIFHFSRTFWILNLSCLFVYGKERKNNFYD